MNIPNLHGILEDLRAKAGPVKTLKARIPFLPAELEQMLKGYEPRSQGEKWMILPRPERRLWIYRVEGGEFRFFWDLGFEGGDEPCLKEVLAPENNFKGAYLQDERTQVGYAWLVLEWILLERHKDAEPPQFASVAEKLLKSRRSWPERLQARDFDLDALAALARQEAGALHPGLDAEIPRLERNQLMAWAGGAALLSFYLSWFIGALVLANGLWGWWRRRKLPWRQHPLQRSLETQNPGTSLEIDGELRQGAETYGKLLLTPHWILERRFFQLRSVDLLQIAWAYARVTTESMNGVKANTYTQLMVHLCGRKDPYKLMVPGQTVMELIQTLHSRFPWAYYGYNKDLYREARQRPQEFWDAVAQRRKQT